MRTGRVVGLAHVAWLAILMGWSASAAAALPTTTTFEANVSPISGDVRIGVMVAACAPVGAPYPSGTVQLFDGATLVIAGPLALGHPPTSVPCPGGQVTDNFAIFTLSAVAEGTHVYKVVYGGDAAFEPSTSADLTVVVPPRNPLATTTKLTSMVDPISGFVRLPVSVESCAPAGAPRPSGNVQLYDGATLLTTTPLNTSFPPTTPVPCAGGEVTSSFTEFPYTTVASGTHVYKVVYAGDALFLPSTSPDVTVVVPPRNPLATTTKLISMVDPVSGFVRLPVSVESCAPAGAPRPSGNVQLYDGATLLTTTPLNTSFPPTTPVPCAGGEITFSFTEFQYPAVASGTHVYKVVYAGDALFLPSTSPDVTVVVPPRNPLATTTKLTSMVDPISGFVRLPVSVESCAPAGAPRPSGNAQLFEGATLLATLALNTSFPPTTPVPCAGGEITFSWNEFSIPAATPGTHVYRVVYGGDALFLPSTSPNLSVVVPPRNPIATTTTIGISVSVFTGEVRLSAGVEACAPSGAPRPSGTVRFFDGARLVGTGSLASLLPPTSPVACPAGEMVGNFIFEYRLPNPGPGTHLYRAEYVGDAVYTGSSSGATAAEVPDLAAAVPATSPSMLALLALLLGAIGIATVRARPR